MASDGFLPKRRKVEHSTNGEPVHVELVKENRVSDHNPTHSCTCMNKSSFEFPRLSQEELKKIYGGRRQRHVIRKSSIEDSEESEEEEGLTEEELKQTEGYKSVVNCIRIIAQKQSVQKSGIHVPSS